MHMSKITGMAVAALFATAPFALAQTPAQTQSQSQSQTQSQDQKKSQDQNKTSSRTDMKADDAAATQTFTGCLMTESAYRSAHHLGAGAVNGLGLGDEFVITDVTVTPANASADTMSSNTAKSSSMSASSSATTCADKGVAYRLTGTQEEKIKPMNIVGHWVAVQGRFKHADDVTANGTATSGKLPAEVEIVSFQEAPAPAATPAPAAAVTEPTPPAPTPAPRTVTPPPTTPAPQPTAPATTEPRELPHTAGSSGMIALLGLFALGSGLAMAAWRRRIA